MILFDGAVPVDYHQFVVAGDGWPDPDEDPEGDVNGLVEVRPGGVTVLCGAQYGDVGLRVEAHPDEPAPDLDGWDEVVDVSVECGGELRVHEALGGAVDGIPDLAFAGPGGYRLRCCARGRDDGQEHAYDDPPAESPWERHALLLWPAPATPARVHKTTDRVGAAFRGEPDDSAPPPLPGHEAALAATQRLIAILAARADPAPSGTAEMELTATFDATPRKVFTRAEALHWWLGRGGIPNYTPGQDFTVHIIYDAIEIRGRMRAVPARGRIEFDMAWTADLPGGWEAPHPRSTVLLHVAKHPDGGTSVTVTHRGLPAGWVDDVRALWRYYLARLARMAGDEYEYTGHHPWDAEATS